MCIIFGNVIRQSRSIGINWDCEIIFKQLGEMANTYIIFCYIQELSEFYFLHKQQPTTINGLHVIFQRYIKLDLKYLRDMLYS